MSTQPDRVPDPHTLPELRAACGIAQLGRQVIVHGKDLHHECLDLSYVQYLLFCATKRAFDSTQARVLERLWISTGYPDARIWCNRIAGYLGAARVDPGLAMSAAIAASDSTTYGFRAMAQAYEVQSTIPEELSEREAWLSAALAAGRILHGYGRVFTNRDERIPAALKILADAGLRAGPALRRAFWLHRELGRLKGIEMNISALWAAIAIDFGIGALEYQSFMLLMFAPGYVAVYNDQRSRKPFSFLAGHQSLPSD
ncbi:MAG TPA: hypothetical protein VKP30_10170 [Polyangiaceae bacterium]|nr:hypothetical protein [Polyangiaceae bacterium]